MIIDREIKRIFGFIQSCLGRKLVEQSGWHAEKAKKLRMNQKTLSKYAKDGPGQRASFRDVFKALTAISEGPPLIVKDDKLLSNLPLSDESKEIEQGVEGLTKKDIDFILKIMAIIKNKDRLNKGQVDGLISLVDSLHENLMHRISSETPFLNSGENINNDQSEGYS